MRKKQTVITAAVLMVVLALTGCQSEYELETDDLTITKYKEVEIEEVEEPEEVTDEDVTAYIDEERNEEAEYVDIEEDRAAEEGDTVNIDYVGYMDGEELENGSEEGAQLVIGEGAYIDGFEESIIGHKKGDTYEWNGKFPDDYAAEDVAGKDVTFKMTLNGIVEEVVPELDDEFAQRMSDTATTAEEYRQEIKDYLVKRGEEEYKQEVADEAWSVVMNNTEVKQYPTDEIEKYLDMIHEEYETWATVYGTDFDTLVTTYLGYETVDDFNAAAEETSENSVKQDMAVDAIADKEGLTLTDDLYEEILEEIVFYYGYTDVETLEEAADEDTLQAEARIFMVKDWVGEHCIQVAGY